MTVGEPATGPVLRRLVQSITASAGADELGRELADWATTAPAFRSYLDRYRDKIRKKLRGSADDDARADVRAELLFARLVLGDRRFDVEFEAHGSLRRGPDYTLTFRRSSTFDAEVTRIRRAPTEPTIAATTATKARQLNAGRANILVIVCEVPPPEPMVLERGMAALRRRADAWDEAYFRTRGYASRRAFYEVFLRLGAVVVWCPRTTGSVRATAWVNPSARTPVAGRALVALVAGLRAGD